MSPKNPSLMAARIRNCLITALLTATGIYAEDLLKIDFSVGHDGSWHESPHLVPVQVTIHNKLENLSGRIEITSPSATVLGTEVLQTKPFQSPNHSVRKFTAFVRTSPGRGLQARVVFDQKVSPQSKTWYGGGFKHIILAVGLPEAFKKQQDEGTNFSSNHKLIRVSHQALPSEPLAYDGVYAIMITGHSFQLLNLAQAQALRDWLTSRGRLFLLNPTFGEAQFTRNLQVTAPGLELLRETGVRRIGAGLLAVQIQRSVQDLPFWCHKDMASMRERFLPDVREGIPSSLFFGNTFIGDTGGIFNDMTRTEKTYGLMGFFWLFLIIGAYIVAIGPLDYWLVKRSARAWLTWIVFGGSIALFSLLAYWYSGVVHSSNMEGLHVNIIDQTYGNDTALGNSLFWIYSTKNTTYHIQPERSDVLLSCRESIGYSSAAWVRVNHEEPMQIQARIPIFSAKTCDATWQAPADWNLDLQKLNGEDHYLLPKDLKVRKVLQVDSTGVYPCKNLGNNKWMRDRSRLSWEQELTKAAWMLRSDGTMPSEVELDQYLFFISFAGMSIDQEYREVHAMRARRDLREASLDISSNLNDKGSVLLVFLDKTHSLLPLKMNLIAPYRAEANLIRIQLKAAK